LADDSEIGMRVWDVSPGYLNRQSLLGEHRELHGLHSILVNGKKGYSRHPETLRWVGCLNGLSRRHAFLSAEMRLRGYIEKTPIRDDANRMLWPTVFVTEPLAQIAVLRTKYRSREGGRIPLPRSPQEVWAQHKYSVLARDVSSYRSLGRRVASRLGVSGFADLVEELVLTLRRPPSRGGLVNALEHMWGYVTKVACQEDKAVARGSAVGLLSKTQELALRIHEPYLLHSTALGELAVFVVAAQHADAPSEAAGTVAA
jgi:hypothetical protein